MNQIGKLLVMVGAIIAQPLIAQPSQNPLLGTPDELGPNYKLWDSGESGAGNANVGPRPVHHRVMALESGMHYWSGNEWLDSNAEFRQTTNGFVADKVQDQALLLSDLNSVDAVNVMTLNGNVLRSTPVGISLYDPVSGNGQVIAVITNSIGVLIASNQVLYPDCFSGGACADIVYTLEKGSFEQDVVFKGRLDPTDWGFPTNSRIQIITEFYEAPVPEVMTRPLFVQQNQRIRQQMVSPDLVDQVLSFDEFVMGTGKAYTYPDDNNTNGAESAVAKQYQTTQGRTFLIETVDSQDIRNSLLTLPPCNGSTPSTGMAFPRNKLPMLYAEIPRPSTKLHESGKLERRQKPVMVSAGKKPRVVIDYVATINGSYSTSTVLQGDTTYHVTGAVYYNGPVTIEGGAVVKYVSGTSITLSSSVSCATSMYRPAFFTAENDNSVGEIVNTNNLGTNGYANPALLLSYLAAPVLSNLHFSYCKQAIQIDGNTMTANITHSQFVQCLQGIDLVVNGSSGSGSGSSGSISLYVQNALFSYVNSPLVSSAGSGNYGNFYFCTFDHSQYVFNESSLPVTVFDSVFANNSYVTASGGSGNLSGNHNGFYNSPTFGSSTYTSSGSPFTGSVGGGAYYLNSASGFQNVGTSTGLPTGLTNALALRTTYAPLNISGTISQSTLWTTNVPRDNSGTWNLGFHYDPLDYLATNVILAGTLSWSNGVAVGVMGSYGFNLQTGAGLSSIGTPNMLNRACFYGNVQESRTNSPTMALAEINGASNNNLWFRFTDIVMGAGNVSSPLLLITNNTVTSGSLGLRDSQVRGCNLNLAPTGTGSAFVFGATNNFIQRSSVGLTEVGGVPLTARCYNNLFLNDSLAVNYTNSTTNPTWIIQDNLFDGTAQAVGGTTTYMTISFNAFASGSSNTLAGASSLTNITANYVTGPLGSYYYPTNGGVTNLVALINAGSTTADNLELFHYTVSTNLVNSLEVKETNSIVDIGYHYVATDANGNPIDTDGDGIPDNLEDSNGNGAYEVGDLGNWLISAYNGLTTTYNVQIYTPLK